MMAISVILFVVVPFLSFEMKAAPRPDRPNNRTFVVYKTPDLTELRQSNPYFYTKSDADRFVNISRNVLAQDGKLPRVLVYAFGDLSRMVKQFAIDGGSPGAASWYGRNLCYTRAHGFDLEFTSPRQSSWWEPSKKKTSVRAQSRDGQLLLSRDDHDFWVLMRDIQAYLGKGKYDYVFVMSGNMLLNEAFTDFPVWAYDSGHDITLMDQYTNNNGFNTNGMLFRSSSATHDFFRKLFHYHRSDEVVLQNGQSAFQETVLRSLGLEAKARGQPGYNDACKDSIYLAYKAKYDRFFAEQVASYSECFFSELERLAGPYGYRDSKLIGFVKTYLWRNNKALTFTDVPNEGSLLPLPNCYDRLQIQPHWQDGCFAYFLNDPGIAHLSQGVQPKCPDASDSWATFYGGNDFLWFKDWSQRFQYPRSPRVLIYTWCTENSFKMYENEAFWKSCYAHVHGYDVVFSDALNVSGVKRPPGELAGEFMDKWYSDDYMWAWNRDVQRFLFSGKYDYVFHVGADVLFDKMYLDFPVWAYDTGHDITIMDQDYVSYGYNQNAVLFKPTAFTREYLDLHYSYRVDYWTQGDNGPWMEAMLVYLGREAEATGRPGYGNQCAVHGKFTMPSGMLLRVDKEEAIRNTTRYSQCFFIELDRLARTFGHREARHVGYSKVRLKTEHGEMLPEHNDLLSSDHVMPWANCFTHVRDKWDRFEKNCFAYHWNGAKLATQQATATGICPDPTFDWKSSPWNYVNRGNVAI